MAAQTWSQGRAQKNWAAVSEGTPTADRSEKLVWSSLLPCRSAKSKTKAPSSDRAGSWGRFYELHGTRFHPLNVFSLLNSLAISLKAGSRAGFLARLDRLKFSASDFLIWTVEQYPLQYSLRGILVAQHTLR